ncbi:efflux RND transporter permease subunit [Aureibacter tunicatorum]|uniref:Multidrug efflux pump subunit AcrB n=1 Tax=Aureibacter tunicatorum TaxID=866807 RepID=A0AAE3XQU9_9BACT|nr:efflux RND transporter permease subunit [Aureibacter tunicatorum]MDR6240270.1 multidrug efflux pump subunit AcrB [Aureibacter tunicatorum]BDD05849.1 multidrug transporter AcrB [Aureibacter tunicatorum]
MKITEFTLKNRALSHFIFMIILFGGVFAYLKMGKLEDAPFTIKQALVMTQYPGASPQEVEEQVSDILEEAIQSLDELDYVISENRAGLSKITVYVKKEIRAEAMPQLWDELRRKVNDAQGKLPPGAHSIVNDDFGDVLGVFYGVSGEGFTPRELDDYSKKIKNEVLKLPGVAKVERYGVQVPTVDVILSPGKMGEAGISMSELVAVLNSQNKVFDAGTINTPTNRVRIAPTGNFSSFNDIKNFMIPAPNGENIRLGDIAKIEEGYMKPFTNKLKINGNDAIGLAVSTVEGGNVVVMAEAVKARLESLKAELPLGIEIDNVYDQGMESAKANDGFIINLIMSVATVVAILLFFIGFRTGILISSGLVYAILATLLVMFGEGIALQRSSLAAIIIAMGMLVDNAIVVADAILINLQRGMSRKDAVFKAVKVSAMPLLGATFIAILTFLPIYLSPHVTGEYFSSLFIVIAVSLFLSWIFAITQTPLYCDEYMKKPKSTGDGTDPFAGGMYLKFRKVLTEFIRRKWLVAAGLVVLLATALAGFNYIPKVFMPDLEKTVFTVNIWAVEGTKIEKMEEMLDEMNEYVESFDEVVQTTLTVGQTPPRYYLANVSFGPMPNFGHMIVETHSFEEVKKIKEELTEGLRERFPETVIKTSLFASMPPYEADIEARFNGPDDQVLDSLVNEALEIMKSNPKAQMFRNEWKNQVMVWQPELDQQRARLANINVGNISNSLRAYADGTPIGVFRDEEKQVPIVMKTESALENGFSTYENAPIWGMGTTTIPLNQLTSGQEFSWEFPMIKRYNRERSMAAQCDVMPEYTKSEVLEELKPLIEGIELPEGYTMFWDSEYKSQKEAMEALTAYLPLAMILLVTILIALFANYKQPVIILLILPLSLIGVSFGLLGTGKEFGFNSIIGWLGLLGMIIKNVIVLLDEANIQKADGKSHFEAIVNATVSRTRPVLMAALTTICGMLPLLPDSVFGSMAATIIFGLSFATLLTLLAVPALYAIFYNVSVANTPQSTIQELEEH